MKPYQKDHLSEANPEPQSNGSDDFQLGEAFIRPSLNRIEMDGNEHQIEPKVMKVLLILCARPGHVVEREQLLKEVWQHTGDDYLLNRAVSELRKIFADKAQKPNYIETIRKTGYRLLAPIKPLANASLVVNNPPTSESSKEDTKPSVENSAPEQAQSSTPHTSTSEEKSLLPKLYWLATTILALGLCLFVVFKQYGSPSEFSMTNYQVYPVTSRMGREYEADLSPDGSRVVYVSDDKQGGSTIYVKMLRGEEALKLSSDNTSARFPLWTPDGQSIIYANVSQTETQFISVSPLGGAHRIIHIDKTVEDLRGLDISADGQQLAYSKRASAEAPQQIWLLSLSSGELRQLTFPKSGSLGDIDPLFTPDGKSLVFVRGSDEVTKDIYLLDISTEKIKRLTFDNRKINGISWSPDGSRILFTSTRSGLYRLWSIDRNGSEPMPLALGLETVQRPTSRLGVEALVFEDWKHQAKIMSVDLAGALSTTPVPMQMSTRWDSNPSISPDGKQIAFASDRGGPYGIWLSDIESEEAHKWINLGGAFIDNPAWSPNGKQLAFDASPDGKAQLYLIEKGSSLPKILQVGPADNRNPNWSRDGEWIYFESNRFGGWQLFALHVGRGEVHPLKIEGGKNPQESADGQWIFYASATDDGIWRCHKENCLSKDGEYQGLGELFIPQMQQKDSSNWLPTSEGIYFVRRSKDNIAKIVFYRFATDSVEDIANLSYWFNGWGMSMTPDESRLIFTEMTQLNSDIRIARP